MTVRWRVTIAATFVVVVVLAIASVSVVRSQRRDLTGRIDAGLASDLTDFATAVRAGDVSVVQVDDGIVQLIGQSATPLAGSIAGSRLPMLGRPARTTGLGPSEQRHVRGHEYRVRARTLDLGGRRVAVVTAERIDDIDASVASLTRSLALAVPFAGLALALTVWWIVGRSLRQVEQANAAQRRLIADVSHELRTPLTRMRTDLEVDLSDGTPTIETHRRVLTELVGMQQLVDDLLTTARPTKPPRRDAVDLDDVALECAARHRLLSSVPIETVAVGAAQVIGDRPALERLVSNLLDNARQHALSRVSVSVIEDDAQAVLTVADDGPGISTDAAEIVFAPFTRLDDARGSSTGGAGLGLAIARSTAEDHGGTLTTDPRSPGGCFVLRLPLAGAGW